MKSCNATLPDLVLWDVMWWLRPFLISWKCPLVQAPPGCSFWLTMKSTPVSSQTRQQKDPHWEEQWWMKRETWLRSLSAHTVFFSCSKRKNLKHWWESWISLWRFPPQKINHTQSVTGHTNLQAGKRVGRFETGNKKITILYFQFSNCLFLPSR